KVTLEGEEIPAEQWADFPDATVTQTRHKDQRVTFQAEKGDEPGTYLVYPQLTTDKPVIGDYGDIEYQLEVTHMVDKSTWSGTCDGNYCSTDTRSWIVRHADKFIKLLILGILAFIIIGYIPGFKKYLPKKLKKMPKIECESKVGMHKQWVANGRLTKNRLSTIIPYRAERGSIKYLPRGVSGGPTLMVKAIGSNRMELTNTKSFMGKDNITFNGQAVPKGNRKNLQLTPGCRIKVENNDAMYTCMLNK
ncbi:MAG: hypothetical protein K5682_01010, partial [Lachnospiraceae bacterium]|nr:hypothetical protein [Lachnospiraceae bacterium]